jgi:hypothetical protein
VYHQANHQRRTRDRNLAHGRKLLEKISAPGKTFRGAFPASLDALAAFASFQI